MTKGKKWKPALTPAAPNPLPEFDSVQELFEG